ncbi:MAG: alkaline phosphatase family protein [Proteobacteria bacterium]|nr:alkaline phosphatase family protein [Pseudomonadota bacterium]
MRFIRLAAVLAIAVAAALPAEARHHAPAKPRNVLIFVADGLRYDSVTPQTAPTMWKLKTQGVDFTNSHSLYPTITTVNASAIATGHYIGDTGNFGNMLYTGYPVTGANGAPITFQEDDALLGALAAHYNGNYLNETSFIAAAREAGYATAVMGKVGPTAIQDITQRDGTGTIVIDDAMNTPKGIAISPQIDGAIKAADLSPTAPKTNVPNTEQQQYLIAVATKVVLPKLAASGHPFAMLYWSRDPDASQHSAKDSFGKLTPGINSASGRAGIKDADDTLAALLAALKAQGLDKATDVFVTADHGFSTIDRHSKTSAAAKIGYPKVIPGETPPGIVAIDLAEALAMPVYDPFNQNSPVDYKSGQLSSFGSAVLGADPANPDVIVVANGGSDHIYLPGANARDLAPKIVDALSKEDYISGIFVNDALGDVPGALPMSAVNLRGSALTPQPSIIVSFASHPIHGCKPLLMCAAEMADTSLDTGQGMHGSFSRADTRNFMAAAGPDFKAHFADPAPVSNADINPTLAHILGLDIPAKGSLKGRVATEALKGGKKVTVTKGWQSSMPAPNGQRTVLEYQRVGGTRYFDAAGFPGRTVGLSPH